MHEGRPNIGDAIRNGEIRLVVNTPVGRAGLHDDSYIRKAAIKHKIPYITTTAAAIAAAKGIAALRRGRGAVKSLQRYHEVLNGNREVVMTLSALTLILRRPARPGP